MRDIILDVMNIENHSFMSVNLNDFVGDDEVDKLFATPQGLFFAQQNGEFTDIVDFNRLKRKEYGKWVNYIILRYTVNGKTYRFVRSRNIYNKKDKPTIVEVNYG